MLLCSGIGYPLVNKHSYWKWPFIVDLPINSMMIFHSYVTLPEGSFSGHLTRCLFAVAGDFENWGTPRSNDLHGNAGMMGTGRRDTGVSQHRCFRLVNLLYHLSRSIQIYPELKVIAYLYINIKTCGWWFQTFLFSIVYGIILPID